ncbi:MAG TPA: hypothetical protein DD670_20225, partial [Planctomycetaceae bacterium]|nr:hypothetical protein [Planctomycetaceae bacterium]
MIRQPETCNRDLSRLRGPRLGMRVKKEMCLALLLISFLPSEAAHAVTVRAADFGYNPVDATSALQAAIDSGADTVIVDKMAADWTIQPVFLNSSNQRIVFEDGVKVVAKAGSFHGIYDCLFLANAQSNITLSGYGATLQMRKDDYLSSDYTDSEFRMAIRLGGCTNVTIEGLTILDTGGDGVCMASWGPDRPWCENVVIRDIVCDNNYRQGISICSVKNLLVDNCIFANTNGTPPASGIDIEPDKLFERIDQVTIQNSIIHANAATNGGIQFALNNFGGEPYKDARVDINHCTIVGNSNQGMWLWDTTSGLTVRNSLFVSNTGYGVYQLYNNLGTLSVEHSAFWDNGSGATRMANVAATSVTGVDPKILSTDINHPYYMHLSADTATTISQGASDGRPMGARPVAPWSGLVLVKEHFTGDPGWIHGPDPDYAGNSFGYSATSRAGGETGEIGGTVHSIGRSIPGTPPVFYGKDLVKPLTLEDSFELNWNTEDGADYYGEQGLNSYVRFGYFDRDAITTWYPVHMGLQMGDDAIYLIYSMHETGWTQQKLLKAGISGTTGHRLRFIYDPDAGPYGRISGQYNDEPIVSMDLTSGDRVRW